MKPHFRTFKSRLSSSRQILRSVIDNGKDWLRRADISFFHEFVPPPTGGGHQFMRALWGELESQGLQLENNTISRTTRACLYNSFNFDFEQLKQARKSSCKMVHRVDGPIQTYRGWDNGTDRRIWQINQELANTTIFQSQYSLNQHLELGLEFRDSHVIMNAANPYIFHPRERKFFDRNRKIRLLSSSWSDNQNKGFDVYQWLDKHLDWQKFDYTFVGRSPIEFKHIQLVPPVNSEQLAKLLRQHDIYISASQNDPCSNSLIEALSCGLPALYLQSGGHPEIVGEAGFGFSDREDIPSLLDRLVSEYEERQAQISLPSLEEVGKSYLAVMGFNENN
ncbi:MULTISPECIES: glycosyltransferase [Spirulina sp. CCY15215]|uniref:glycosyltransferase n=1 Tax=Spirulina sp. CCY15215 TaxID=2767591 RepID=UPI00194DD24B